MKTWKLFESHISKLHSDIQGELKDFPLKIDGRYETIVKFVYRKKSNKYVCELCQKDWESMNDLEKHLKENHAGVKGKLKIDVAYGKTIIRYDTTTFVKNLDKDCGTIPIGLDEPIVIKNDPGKKDIIDDPGKRDEKNIVQDPLNEPMDVNHQGNENDLDIEGKKKHS